VRNPQGNVTHLVRRNGVIEERAARVP